MDFITFLKQTEASHACVKLTKAILADKTIIDEINDREGISNYYNDIKVWEDMYEHLLSKHMRISSNVCYFLQCKINKLTDRDFKEQIHMAKKARAKTQCDSLRKELASRKDAVILLANWGISEISR